MLPTYVGAAEEYDEYIVQFKGNAANGLLNAFGIEEDQVIHEFDLLPVYQLELTDDQADALLGHPQVKALEDNAEVQKLGQVPYGVTRVQGVTAQNAGFNGNGIRVAVLDTGIDRSHPDLQANVRGGYSVFTDVANRDPYFDGDGHGTHVAGTVAAARNGVGVIGVAPNASLYAVKVLNNNGSGSLAGIAQGIEWSVNNNMNVINMSLGSSQGSSILQAYTDLAYQRGILVVAAAGNSGNAAGNTDTVNFPARYSSAMAVAATDQNNRRGSFSSTGPTVEISAPGVGVLSTLPGNRYGSLNGTSMAAPHVAGVAAQVWQAKPNLSNVQLRQLLNSTATPLGSSFQYGSGLVQSANAINR
ncbi:S8 family peptidase [Paenalkalicoccus suaedae]|uniref:S8 family peptidase n=2 Tax=Paenalkalicoccus suaedae TaxID=2592382 RepID=A0A859FKM1_9BACI|nr:S8 family peptidase [Paenalkalicoccus suaedae]